MSTIAEVLASQQQSYVGTYTAGNFDSMKEDIARWAEKNPDSPFAADPTFTRSKGGTAEREEIISQIQVPDLYLLAEEIIRPGHRILKVNRERFADMLIETWHLAHDMRKHLQTNG